MNTTAVGVALVGCGNFARWQHLPNLARLPQADLRWLCDRDLDLAEELAERHGCRACKDAAEVFADPRVQAVVIAVRDELQAELCQAALAHGKHVYVEKPVGISPEQVQAVVSAADRAGRQVAVGFQKRCAPAYLRAKELLDADGGVYNLSLRMCDDAWRWAHGYEPGALLVHDCCHLFDLAAHLCGSPVVEVIARRARPDDEVVLLRMACDAVVTLTNSGHGTMDMPKERLEAISARGGVSVEDFCELHAYGYEGVDPVERFAGSSHPDRPLLPRYLLADQGAAGLASIRRIAWQLRQDQALGRLDGRPDAAEAEAFIAATIPNFLREQGWLAAMREFLARCAGAAPQLPLAAPSDALAASRVAAAALRSLSSGSCELLGEHHVS
ncbi:MAG: gfo/Idh/MocA family oxidoreductase [Planctomycetota bacterium]|nr:MAG: gfo/Idh/MocA family oxidoreductase [Planctomycetota bacterium]